MKRVGRIEYAAAVSVLSIIVMTLACVLGGLFAWLLLATWNFFVVSVGLPWVLPITLKSIFASWCLLVVFRFIFRRPKEDKK